MIHLWALSLYILKTAPEEAQDRVQHEELTVGGGNIVSFIWEDLDSKI